MSSSGPLSILLVGNYPNDRQQSMQRYAELLRDELAARGHSVRLLRPEPVLGRLISSGSGVGKWLGYMDKFLIFPFILHREARAVPGRVVHICDHSNSMYSARLRGLPQLVTCHDILAIRSALGHFPQVAIGWTGRRLQAWILASLRRSPRIVCVSAETRRQLLVFPGFEGKPVTTVPNGLNHPYTPLSDSESRARFAARPVLAPWADRAYVFFVGGNQWYKNRAGVLRIFMGYAAANPDGADLLIAGKSYSASDEKILSEAPPALRARVHHVGSPDNEGLHALYARARCLLFPSLEEGFGWPIIEAMSSGCPVVTSARPPMNEIGGEPAVTIDPLDEKTAALRLADFLAETAEARAARIAAGIVQASKFSTEAMMAGLIDTYRIVAERA